MFETILVPLDGSVLAEQSIIYAKTIAEKFLSRIILFTVCESGEKDQIAGCWQFLDSKAELLKDNSQVEKLIQKVVVSGQPASQIIDFARQHQVSLIIMTSHGRSGLGPWPMGGTANKVFHSDISVPLLLVNSRQKDLAREFLFEKILIPLDGSVAGESAVSYAFALAEKFHSEITLLHVIEQGRHVHTIGGLQYVPFLDQDIETAKNRAEKYFNSVASKLAPASNRVLFEIVVGDATREILKTTEKMSRCLIALSTHGYSGVSAWSFGSVTYKITQVATQSFLIVKSH